MGLKAKGIGMLSVIILLTLMVIPVMATIPIATPIPTPPLPPFLDNLNITPTEIKRGDNVTISVDIMNPNNHSITYAVDMHIENVNDPSSTGPPSPEPWLRIWVDLGAYESKTVSHTITMDTIGDFNVTVHGMTGSFMVKWLMTTAEFVLSELEVLSESVASCETTSPVEVEVGEYVIFSVLVKNIGDTEGTRIVVFKVDGETVDIQIVTVAADSSLRVRAYYEAKAGASHAVTNLAPHQVSVGGLTETFMVLVPFKFAEFVLSNFNYTSELKEGEPLRIYVDIANVGELPGEATIIIKIDGAIPLAPQFLQSLFQLGPGDICSQVWTSYQPFEVGTHTIHLDGFEGTFNVIAEPVPFWKSPEFVMVVIVVILGVVAIYVWRRWGFGDLEHIPPFYFS